MSRIEEIFTPVRWEKFQSYLKNYDEVEKQFVIQGFRDGFHLHSSIDRNIVLEHENMPSAFHYPEVVWEKITKEVRLQRVGGPFDAPPFAKYICSPLGLVPKAGQPGKFIDIQSLCGRAIGEWNYCTTIPNNVVSGLRCRS